MSVSEGAAVKPICEMTPDEILAELIRSKLAKGEPVYGDSPRSYGGSQYRECGPRFDSKPTQPKE